MAKLTVINNPFNPQDKNLSDIGFNVPIHDVISLNIGSFNNPDYDYIFSVNGVITEDYSYLIKENDHLAVVPVPLGGDDSSGKTMLRTIAMIALVAYAPMLSAEIIGMSGLTGTAAHVGYYAAYAGTMYAGGVLIDKALPLQGHDNAIEAGSPTYSFSVDSNSYSEGTVLPIVLGTARIYPPVIGMYIDTSSNKQYLNMLMAINDGIVDSITSIQVNDKSVDEYVDRTGESTISTYRKYGTNTQSEIDNFTDAIHTYSQNVTLNNTLATLPTYTTASNSVSKIQVCISLPAGLYKIVDGKQKANPIEFDIRYRKQGETSWSHMTPDDKEQNWVYRYEHYGNEYGTPPQYVYFDSREGISDCIHYNYETTEWWYASCFGRPVHGSNKYKFDAKVKKEDDNINTITITSIHKDPARITYSTGPLEPSEYEIEVERITAYNDDVDYVNELVVDYINETVSTDLTYPNVALLGVDALATDQLSGGIPKVSCVVQNINLSYWENGSLIIDYDKRLDNPAWASYSLLKRVGVPDVNIDVSAFQDWADWCETNSYTCNLIIDKRYDLPAALRETASLGRATINQIGTRWTPTVDRVVSSPVQSFLFTSGNIIKDSFNIDYIPYSGRSNVVTVTYYDKDSDYDAMTVQAQSEAYTNTANEIKTTLSLKGCTDRTMAAKYAQYLINKNRYISETVSFSADIDAIACTIGDVIKVGKRYLTNSAADGRVVSFDEVNNKITIDENVVLEPGVEYAIDCRISETDSIIDLQIVETDGVQYTSDGFSILSVAAGYSETPSSGDVYSLGEVGLQSSLYRVESITRSNEFRRKIEAIEYIPEVYDDALDVPDEIVKTYNYIKNVSARNGKIVDHNGIARYAIIITWTGNSGGMNDNVYVNGIFMGYSSNGTFIYQNPAYGETYNIRVGERNTTGTYTSIVFESTDDFVYGRNLGSHTDATLLNPMPGDTYENTTDGIVYYYNGTSWVSTKGDKGDTGDTGATGEPGLNGYTVKLQYSSDNLSWHDTLNPTTDKYIRSGSAMAGSTNYVWQDGVKFVPEKGVEYDDGDPGSTAYFHVAYADTSAGGGFSQSPTGKEYIGTYSDFTEVDSSSPGDYTWALIKGDKGDTGDTGATGEPGLNGYTVKLQYSSDNLSWHDTLNPTTDKYIRSGSAMAGSTNYVWQDGVKFVPEKGVEYDDGDPGSTAYFHVAYADTSAGGGFSQSPTGKEYIGTYSDFTEVDSSSPGDYTWALIKGDKGDTGDTGATGEPGLNGYTVKLQYSSDNLSWHDTLNPTTDKYIRSGSAMAGSTNYVWQDGVKFVPEKGVEYDDGDPGSTAYFHVAYADTSAGGGFSQSPTGKEYIGTYSDFTEVDSSSPGDYTWALIKGDKGDTGDTGATGEPGLNGYTVKLQYSSDNLSWHDTLNPTTDKYIRSGSAMAGSTNYVWQDGVKFVPEKGVEYDDGDPGSTAYFHVAYADTSAGGGFSQSPTGKEYIGTYSDFTEVDSSSPGDYTWALIKGDKGDTGDTGATGEPGLNGYTVKLQYSSDNLSWHDTLNPTTDKYIRSGSAMAGSTNYVWQDGVKFVPEKGVEYDDGDPGSTAYFHVAYADTSAGGGFSQSPTGKEYIGTYSDFTEVDSSSPGDYTWALIKGDKGDTGDTGATGEPGLNGYTVKLQYSSDNLSWHDTLNPTTDKYIRSGSAMAGSTNYVWQDGVKFVPEKGVEYDDGDPGSTAYFHVAYADTSAGGGFSQSPTGKEYIGTYSDFTEVDSSSPGDYTWALIKGDKGDTGDTGDKGDTGATGEKGDTGDTGATGARGAMSVFSQTTYTTTPTDTQLANEIGYSPLVNGDSVTYVIDDGTTSSLNGSYSAVYNGSTWNKNNKLVVHGNMLVYGTVVADSVSANNVEAGLLSGNIVIDGNIGKVQNTYGKQGPAFIQGITRFFADLYTKIVEMPIGVMYGPNYNTGNIFSEDRMCFDDSSKGYHISIHTDASATISVVFRYRINDGSWNNAFSRQATGVESMSTGELIKWGDLKSYYPSLGDSDKIEFLCLITSSANIQCASSIYIVKNGFGFN